MRCWTGYTGRERVIMDRIELVTEYNTLLSSTPNSVTS